jgi:hypothetical protein
LEIEMTDGPFRNSALDKRWRRYAEDLVNDAVSQEERSAQLCMSLLSHDIDLKAFSGILQELRVRLAQPQMTFDPMGPVLEALDKYDRSPTIDLFERSMRVQLLEQPSGTVALDEAVKELINNKVQIGKSRIDEECIRAREIGDMSQESYRKAIDRNRETANSVNRDALREALFSGKADAFKEASKSKKDLDEGPVE